MEEADRLCELLYLWLEKQERCSEKLLALAEDLESRRFKSTVAQTIGNATAVVGFSAAIAATVLTAGLAAPLVAAGAGAVVTLASKLTESGLSMKTMREAKDVIKKVEEIEGDIQIKLKALKEKCGGSRQGAHSSTDSSDDESDEESEVNTQILVALARRHKLNVPVDLLRSFSTATNFHRAAFSGRGPSIGTGTFVRNGLLAFSFFALNASISVSSKEAVKHLGFFSMKATIKQTARVAGCSLGLGLSLYDYIQNIKDLARDDHKTEASKSLRDSARKMKEHAETLKENLDAQREIIKKLSELKVLIKKLGGYSCAMDEIGEKVLNYIAATCYNQSVISWLEETDHQVQLLNHLRFVRDHLLEYLEEETKRQRRRHLHIVFVAHGTITESFMPAAALVPTPSIIDTLLYSPWNCLINAVAACGIAEGSIKLEERLFLMEETGQKANKNIPSDWNSMRESIYNIPVIMLHSMHPDDDNAWKKFVELGGNLYREDRIIVPYIMPSEGPGIPFFVLVFATSFLLMITGVKATVHLVASLDRAGSTPKPKEWAKQYSYTDDETYMTLDRNAKKMDQFLLEAMKSMFDICNRGH
ncbi:uncharacterized protein [Hoplias malabaricus]|uniref:uncharacterized protein n=1 Tax=Hoplias malabaricus TaxID=27720 RepID=UPI003461BCD6